MSSKSPVVLMEHVTKTFEIRDSHRRARWHGLRPGPHRSFTAVDDVDLRLLPGEVVGLVGANGAGKSTLLKLLSRVMYPDRGKITLGGPVMSLLEVGAGFHPELTARENVYLNGAILGLGAASVRRSFDAIVDLAGVQEFLEVPVKRFSSGMKVRLAIAVGLHLECDAVVLDEVLSVGDAEFQRRALEILDRMVEHQGRAALLVSHNMQTIQKACHRVLVLEHGRLAYDGDPGRAVEIYFQQVAGNSGGTEASFAARTNPHGSHALHLQSMRLVNERGDALVPVTEGALGFEVDVDLSELTDRVTLSVALSNRSGALLASATQVLEIDTLAGRGKQAVLRWATPVSPLAAGRYTAAVSLADAEGTTLDSVEDALTFAVTDPEQVPGSLSAALTAGHVRLDGQWLVVQQYREPSAPRSAP